MNHLRNEIYEVERIILWTVRVSLFFLFVYRTMKYRSMIQMKMEGVWLFPTMQVNSIINSMDFGFYGVVWLNIKRMIKFMITKAMNWQRILMKTGRRQHENGLLTFITNHHYMTRIHMDTCVYMWTISKYSRNNV